MSPIRLRVKDYRERQGLTQVELAEKAGVRRATVSDYERGRLRIDLAVLEKLANALGVDAALLIEHRKGKR
jgi:transcriptional regulator with XRE-family HTH domain